jgi:hypothetical protein
MYQLACLIVCIFGFAVCFAAFYPGLLSPDALWMYEQVQNFSFFDWQAPVMGLLWAGFDRLSSGPQGMLVFLLLLYWGALFQLALAASRIDRFMAPAMLVLGFMPFTINFVGTIWVDVLLATSWLMCAALAFSAHISPRPMSPFRATLAWGFFLIGAWTRANALFAAMPLGLYLLKPKGVPEGTKRVMLVILLAAGIWSGNWVISYPILHANRTYPIHSIVTYDLAGISHFSGRVYFPLSWIADEAAKIKDSCYTAQSWNEYLFGECKFVRDRLREEGLWGSTALWRAWISAITREPIAYLQHRCTHFVYFLTTIEYVFHEGSGPDEIRGRVRDNFAFQTLRDYVFGSARLWMFQPIFWLVLAMGCVLASRHLPERSRQFVMTLGTSSLVYLGTYFFVGVASNFRYAYWAVLATGTASVILACEWSAALREKREFEEDGASRGENPH